MEDWQRELQDSLIRPEDLSRELGIRTEGLEPIMKEYRVRITPQTLKQIKNGSDAVRLQVVPDIAEGDDLLAPPDPLNEDADSPAPHLVHRYPDRVLLMVTNQCPIYCRFCTRKRLVGKPGFLSKGDLEAAVGYISRHPEIRDVILSGGDPLLLTDKHLERVVSSLRAVPHLEIIRIGTRVPGTLPSRITDSLCAMLKKYHPFYMNLHFNHPDELTPEVQKACEKLADAGIPLGSQTVLLKGVNDDVAVMKRLMQKLLACRVKPYYLYQADLTQGTNHFRTTVEKGLEIIKGIQGHTSGMGVPHYVIDAPGGGGKIPILPQDYLVDLNPREAVLSNYEGRCFTYPQVEADPAPEEKNPTEKLFKILDNGGEG